MTYAALPVLRTPRLTLRPLKVSDADAIVQGVGNYDVSRWLGRVPYPYEMSDACAFIDRVQQENLMIWAIDTDQELIGVVGLDEELGYWLARPFWRRGYGFEAASAAVAHWFSDPSAGDLVSGHYDENIRSMSVLKALGFQEVGRSQRFARSLAQEVPGTDVVLTRKRWDARRDFTLYTPRLTLRTLTENDAQAMAELLVPTVARHLMLFVAFTSASVARDIIRRSTWRGYPGFRLAICQGDTLIGSVGIGGNPVSLSYFLGTAYWGQGLMTEALSAFLPEVFERLPLNRLVADHFDDNPASGAVLSKLGFDVTGEDVGTSKARVEPHRVITYALHRDNLKVPS